jgi:hypothetical protein
MGNLLRRAAQGIRNAVGRVTGGRAGTRQIAGRTRGVRTGGGG